MLIFVYNLRLDKSGKLMKFLRNIIMISLLLVISSCSKDKNENESDLTPTKFVIGTSADNPPYEQISDGEIVGFDIDLAKIIASELKQELVIKNLDFVGLLPSLMSENVDAVISSVSITEERAKNVDFSIPYMSTNMQILYNSETDYKTIEDLKGKKIGVQTGTTWEDYAKEIAEKFQDVQVKSLSNNLVILQELINGNIDCMILEDLQVSKFLSKYPNLKYMPIPGTQASFAIVLPKNSPLKAKCDEIIEKFQKNGELNKLKAKWLSK